MTLTLFRTGDLSYATAVTYNIYDNQAVQLDRADDREVVFFHGETEKEIVIVLSANYESNMQQAVIVTLSSSRMLDADNVPVRIGLPNLFTIDVTNREYEGPYFPNLPVVANEGETVTSEMEPEGLYYDQPILCITVSVKSLNNIIRRGTMLCITCSLAPASMWMMTISISWVVLHKTSVRISQSTLGRFLKTA